MKLSNDLVVIDLEVTKNQEYIIEIGAVYLDRKLNFVDTFETLVKPESQIEPEIEAITGITNQMVKEADTFNKASNRLETWVLKYSKRLKNVKLCAWGTYFDANVLRNCYKNYGIKFPFSGTWYDIKTIAALYYVLSGTKQEGLSVGNVAKDLNIIPDGAYHRALVDAKAEAQILQRTVGDLRNGFFLPPSKNYSEYKYIKISV